jgi:hypothetical protein
MIHAVNNPMFVDDHHDGFVMFVAARFKRAEPCDLREATALRTVREAFVARAETERALRNAVVGARHDGHSWASIGAMVVTSGTYDQADPFKIVQTSGLRSERQVKPKCFVEVATEFAIKPADKRSDARDIDRSNLLR